MKTKRRPLSSPMRSLLKTITWRVIATLSTFAVGWGLTGNVRFGLALGGLDALSKTVLYYMHERAWEYSSFGLTKKSR